MAKSSINLQLATIFAFLHNLRKAIVSYTIDKESRNEYDRSIEEAYSYYLSLLKEAISNYTGRTGQKIQTDEKKFLWEAVVNLNENHTLEDLEKLSGVLKTTYGWRSVQNSIHRDEGHIDPESGKKIYNYHGHIVFFMLDEDGIYRFKKRDFGIKKMEELQTLTANVLRMERGTSKKITKRTRLSHGQYRQVAQEKENMQKVVNGLELSAEEDDLFMRWLNEEVWRIMEINNNNITEIANLNEWKKNIIKDIYAAKIDGFLTVGSSLDHYIPSNPTEAEINGKAIQILSSEEIIDDKLSNDSSSLDSIKP